MNGLPPILSVKEITKRLQKIFPEGTTHRMYVTRDLSASTIYTMLYIGAIEGLNTFLSPKHVYKMTDKQSRLIDDDSRIKYSKEVLMPGKKITGKRWYADNTRESIRDETLREGLVYIGAATVKKDVSTTSSKPRYALKIDFADLFNPSITGEELDSLIAKWQEKNLSKGALARVQLIQSAELTADHVLVTFPNKETRRLSSGLSSIISKDVIEKFSKNFLENPIVLWLSESGNKVIARDETLAKRIGMQIDASLDLPDIILVDLTLDKTLLIFIEVVATDGAITDRRKAAIYKITDAAGFNRSEVLFVTAYQDKNSPAFKKTISNVTLNSFIWFASEPNNIFILKEGKMKLSKLSQLFNTE
jgi:hypothetical protein